MAATDLIIAFFADSKLLDTYLSELKQPYNLFVPQVANRQYKEFVQSAGGTVLGIWNKAKKAGQDLNRVCVMGFSEGCQGVSAVLDCPDAAGIDVVIPVDGIHRQFTDPVTKAINPVALSQYISFARLAAANPPSSNPNGKLMVITHSAIGASSLPAGMASTTQTANVIYKEALSPVPAVLETSQCGWDCPAAVNESALASIVWPNAEMPVGTKTGIAGTITDQGWTTVRPSAAETGFLPSATFTWSGFADGWKTRLAANNLYIYGWEYETPNHTKDPTGNRDHVFQANMVLPYVARQFLVKRWNPKCGPIAVATNGFGYGYTMLGDNSQSCSASGNGTPFGAQPPAPLPDPYPMGIALPVLSTDCPPPGPGQIIIGRPGDPCWTGVTPEGSDLARFLVGVGAVSMAAVAGYFGTKAAVKYLRRQRAF